MSTTVGMAWHGSSAGAPVPDQPGTTLSLALAEGRRLLRHPLVLVGMELSLYLYGRGVVFGPMPVGPRDGVQIGYAILPLAAATLLASNWAALRDRRHGREGLYGSLPMEPVRRTAARLLSLAAPVALAAVVTLVGVAMMRVAGGVGVPSAPQMIAGPAIVALGGALGILLACLTRGFGLAPVAMIGLPASWYFPFLLYQLTGRVKVWDTLSFWLFPWYGAKGYPADWLNPLAGTWHLAYVGGLAGLTACLALVLSSMHRRVRPRTVCAAVLALALTVSCVVVQARSVSDEAERHRVEIAIGVRDQECRTRGEVRYCAWPTFVPWISRFWEPPIAGVWRRLPAGQRPTLTVRQMELGDFMACLVTSACSEPASIRDDLAREISGALDQSHVRPNASWPRDSLSQGEAELSLAASAAARAVGLPMARQSRENLTVCVPGQARVVVALWLAGQSTTQAGKSLKARVLGKATDPRHASPREWTTLGLDAITVQWPWPEAVDALVLMRRPPDEVARQLQQDWVRWTSPDTPTRELAETFGLPPVPAPPTADAAGSHVGEAPGCDSGGLVHAQN